MSVHHVSQIRDRRWSIHTFHASSYSRKDVGTSSAWISICESYIGEPTLWLSRRGASGVHLYLHKHHGMEALGMEEMDVICEEGYTLLFLNLLIICS